MGLSQEGFLFLSSPTNNEDDDVREELEGLMPRPARILLSQLAGKAEDDKARGG